MNPKTKHKYVGIEIECLSTMNENEVKKIFNKHNMSDILVISKDGSITPDSQYVKVEHTQLWSEYYNRYMDNTRTTIMQWGYEFKLLSKEISIEKNLDRVDAFLIAIKATVNKSCGLHVHIDCRERPFLSVFQNLVAYQETLFKMVAISRRNNEYCERTKLEDILEGERHTAINPMAYQEHKTIEVRVHEGTIDCIEIGKWAHLLCSIADQTPLTESQKNYVKARIRKFN